MTKQKRVFGTIADFLFEGTPLFLLQNAHELAHGFPVFESSLSFHFPLEGLELYVL
jgi:hypothetical protein